MQHVDGSLWGAGETRPPAASVVRGDRGMVLLEAALAIPLLLVVALAGLATVRLGIDELATVSAAREAAVLAARGASPAEVRGCVLARLPGAQVAQGGTVEEVWVSVTARTSVIPLIGAVSVQHEARSTAAKEPGT